MVVPFLPHGSSRPAMATAAPLRRIDGLPDPLPLRRPVFPAAFPLVYSFAAAEGIGLAFASVLPFCADAFVRVSDWQTGAVRFSAKVPQTNYRATLLTIQRSMHIRWSSGMRHWFISTSTQL